MTDIFSIEFSSSLLAKAKSFFSKIDLSKSKNQYILTSIIGGLGGLCLLLTLKNNWGAQDKDLQTPILERVEKEVKEPPKEETKENTEKPIQNPPKSSNPSFLKASRTVDIKASNATKPSLKGSKVYEDDSVHRLPPKNNFSYKLKERNVFRDYTSFEEDVECDSLSTKEERLIHHKRRVTSYSTDNEVESRNLKAKRHQILSMAKEGDPSDQLFFKLYANLSNQGE